MREACFGVPCLCWGACFGCLVYVRGLVLVCLVCVFFVLDLGLIWA